MDHLQDQQKIACNNCKHFTPDPIGDGAGIGSCGHGVKATKTYPYSMPLFRHALRLCRLFTISDDVTH